MHSTYRAEATATFATQRVNRIWNGRRGTFNIWKADRILHYDLVASAFVFDPNYFDSSVTEVTDYQLLEEFNSQQGKW